MSAGSEAEEEEVTYPGASLGLPPPLPKGASMEERRAHRAESARIIAEHTKKTDATIER